MAHNVPHVGVNFPILRNNNSFSPDLRATANGQAVRFETLADVDAIVRREFMDALPLVLARTILSSAGESRRASTPPRGSAGDGWAWGCGQHRGQRLPVPDKRRRPSRLDDAPQADKTCAFPDARRRRRKCGRARSSGADIGRKHNLGKTHGAATPASVRIFDFKDGAAEKHVRQSADVRAKK